MHNSVPHTPTLLFQQQGDAMRHDAQRVEMTYHQAAAEFAAEQVNLQNKSGPSYILADLNIYAKRCNISPQTFQE